MKVVMAAPLTLPFLTLVPELSTTLLLKKMPSRPSWT